MKNPLGLVVLLALLLPVVASGDVGPPAHMQITEREAGLFTVQWRVPKVLPPRAIPIPALPETCALIGEPEVADQPAAWLITGDWRCESTLAGQEIGMRYPFPDLALTTVVRVDLLSGDRFAHVLTPEELSWRLPEGTAAPDVVLEAQRVVVAGAGHVLGSWLHLVFLLVVGLLGGSGRAIKLISVFTLAQVAGVVIAAAAQTLGLTSLSFIGPGPAEIGFAVGVALLARQAMEPREKRQRLDALAGAAGFVHGLGIARLLAVDMGEEASGTVAQLLAALGMDAVHLAGAVGATAIIALTARPEGRARARGALAYSLGATAMALAITVSLQGVTADAGAVSQALQAPAGSVTGPGGAVAASRRLAPAVLDAPIQSFLSVEPFEVRQEAMFRLAGLTGLLGLDPGSTLEIADQPAVADRLAELVLANTYVLVDGQAPEAMLRRVDFMTVDPTGALPRPNPLPEPVIKAVVGVIVAYPTDGMPGEISLAWEAFPTTVEAIPTTVIDPEAVTTQSLSSAQPSLTWENALIEDPIPSVEAVVIEPSRLPVPLLSLPLLLLAAILVVVGMKGSHAAAWVAAARVALALALLVGPLAQTSFAFPGSAGRTPSERQARRILAGLLPNIYRALEFREETMIYDRLAVSVTGETLTEVYLEQRQALEMEERGGAQARVESVEVLEAGEIEATELGFAVRATWTVGGMVTHFGHRHFRQNRYDARIGIVPETGTWKIQSIEVLEQERVR